MTTFSEDLKRNWRHTAIILTLTLGPFLIALIHGTLF